MRVLLLSEDKLDLHFFGKAAEQAAFPLNVISSAEEAVTEIQNDPATLLVVDVDDPGKFKTFENLVISRIGLYSHVLSQNLIFFVAPRALYDTHYAAASELIGHFIHRSYTNADVPVMARLFAGAANEKRTPLEAFLKPGVAIEHLKPTHSKEKIEIVEKIRQWAVQCGFKQRMATIISDGADELIMNAIYDGPVDASGRHIYASTPRTAQLELSGRNAVDVKLSFDDNWLAISVSDNYGSFDKRKLFVQHLSRSFKRNDYESSRNSGAGAGLGLAYLYRNCGGLLMSVEQGEKTEAMLFYRRADSFKEFKDQFRFLSTLMYFS